MWLREIKWDLAVIITFCSVCIQVFVLKFMLNEDKEDVNLLNITDE